MNDLVECIASQSYPERPLALYWQGQRLEVAETRARWRTPDEVCFLVRTTDEQEFELKYDLLTDLWHVRQP